MEQNIQRIVETYSDTLLKIAMHYTKNLGEAEDVVQTVYLKLLQSQKIFESAEHEKAWLIRVCINLCKDMLKSSWKQKVTPTGDGVIAQECIDDIDSAQPEILGHLRKLPSNQKIAIFLHYYQQKSVQEIAQIMDTKQGTVLSWLHRGRERLKKYIKEDF